MVLPLPGSWVRFPVESNFSLRFKKSSRYMPKHIEIGPSSPWPTLTRVTVWVTTSLCKSGAGVRKFSRFAWEVFLKLGERLVSPGRVFFNCWIQDNMLFLTCIPKCLVNCYCILPNWKMDYTVLYVKILARHTLYQKPRSATEFSYKLVFSKFPE